MNIETKTKKTMSKYKHTNYREVEIEWEYPEGKLPEGVEDVIYRFIIGCEVEDAYEGIYDITFIKNDELDIEHEPTLFDHIRERIDQEIAEQQARSDDEDRGLAMWEYEHGI